MSKQELILFVLFLALICAIVFWLYGNRYHYFNRLTSVNRWSAKKAARWYAEQEWPIGPNFTPSYAENTLEMWQNSTFDPKIIEEELGLVEETGMNTVRLFLHYILFQADSESFLRKIRTFLDIAEKKHVKVIPVFFDDVWDPFFKLGQQKPPVPHKHNSRWVQCPGKLMLLDEENWDPVLKDYVSTIVREFSTDQRILFWDIYNEPANPNTYSYGAVDISPSKKNELSLRLLEKAFEWARAEEPSQPLTSAPWQTFSFLNLSPLENFQLSNSDIITFHNYAPRSLFKRYYQTLVSIVGKERPIICTEYMARTLGSTFQEILPFAKHHKIGAINWGFVNGRTQTIYPWDSWWIPYTEPPKVWFHDVYEKDGTPFSEEEVALIKKLTKKQR